MDNAIIQSETINVKPEGMFRTAVMGFKRDDVLEYIENLCNENILQQSQLSQTVYALREQLSLQTAKNAEAQQQLSARLAELTTQNEQLTAQLTAAVEEGNALKATLHNREQEYAALQEKNAALLQQKKEIEEQIEKIKADMQVRAQLQDERERSLSAQMQEIINKRTELEKTAQTQLAQAKQQAESILAQANTQVNTIISEADMRAQGLLSNATQRAETVMSEAEFKAKQVMLDAEQKAQQHKQLMAGGIKQLSDSLAELKNNLSVMEDRIAEANNSVQNAALQMNSALGSVQENITSLGKQVDEYPAHTEQPLLKPEEMAQLEKKANEMHEQAEEETAEKPALTENYVELNLPEKEPVPVYAGMHEQAEAKTFTADGGHTAYNSNGYDAQKYTQPDAYSDDLFNYSADNEDTAALNIDDKTDYSDLKTFSPEDYAVPADFNAEQSFGDTETQQQAKTDYSDLKTFSPEDYAMPADFNAEQSFGDTETQQQAKTDYSDLKTFSPEDYAMPADFNAEQSFGDTETQQQAKTDYSDLKTFSPEDYAMPADFNAEQSFGDTETQQQAKTDYSDLKTFSPEDYAMPADNGDYKPSTVQDIIDSLKSYDSQSDYNAVNGADVASIYSELDEELAKEQPQTETNHCDNDDLQEFYGSLIKSSDEKETMPQPADVSDQQQVKTDYSDLKTFSPEDYAMPADFSADQSFGETQQVIEQQPQHIVSQATDTQCVENTVQSAAEDVKIVAENAEPDFVRHSDTEQPQTDNNAAVSVNEAQAEPTQSAEQETTKAKRELDEFMQYMAQQQAPTEPIEPARAVYNKAPDFEAREEKPEERFYDFVRQPGGFVSQPELNAGEYAQAIENGESQVQRTNLPGDFGEIPHNSQLFGQERAAKRNVLESVANMLGKNNNY